VPFKIRVLKTGVGKMGLKPVVGSLGQICQQFGTDLSAVWGVGKVGNDDKTTRVLNILLKSRFS
jgi:hypothetical protein